MPIKRLQKSGQAQFPNIGKLRKGAERPESGNRPGTDLEYFRFTTDDERAAKMFAAAYGDEPADINVYLPFKTADENFSSWQEKWVAGGLEHRCDGETCVRWLDGDHYSEKPIPCPGGCKEVGRLMVIIPELQRLAYVTVETHSINDIINIDDNLRAVEALAGSLEGIPFNLRREPHQISTPGASGKRVRREKWLITIEVDPVWAAQRLTAMHTAAIASIGHNAAPMLTDNDIDEITVLDAGHDESAYVGMATDEDKAAMQAAVADAIDEDHPAAISQDDQVMIDAQVAVWDGMSINEIKSWAIEHGWCANTNEAGDMMNLAKIDTLGDADKRITANTARAVKQAFAVIGMTA